MSITKRGDKYMVRLYKTPAKTFDTQKEARLYRAQMINLRNGNPNIEVSDKTIFGEIAKKYLEKVSRTRAHNTYKSYESKYRMWIQDELQHFQIGKVTLPVITNFQDELRQREIGDATFDLVNIVLYEIMNFAASSSSRYIMQNPMPKKERKQTMRKPLSSASYWTMEEAEKLIEAAKDSPYYDSIVFILNTGLRFNEFACIQKECFDINSGVLSIYQQICERQKDGANFYIKTTKGKDSRSAPLNPVARGIATRLVRESKDFFLFCPGGTVEKNIMIKKGHKSRVESHKVMTNRTFAYAIQSICKRAGVKYIGPHGLRHTFSANYLMNGGDIFTLSRFLGHKSVTTTIENYGHLSKEFLASAANIVMFGESR